MAEYVDEFMMFYCLVYNKRKVRLTSLGYWPILIVFDYVKYQKALETLRSYLKKEDNRILRWRVRGMTLKESYTRPIGIEVNWEEDPVDFFRSIITLGVINKSFTTLR